VITGNRWSGPLFFGLRNFWGGILALGASAVVSLLLDQGVHYAEIAERTGASTANDREPFTTCRPIACHAR